MTREQAKKILGENATDEQITNLLNSLHTELEGKDKTITDLTEQLSNSQNKVTELTSVADELKQLKESQMTAQEKVEEQKKELAIKLSEASKLVNATKAKSILIGAGVSNERAEKLVNKFVKEDEQATIDLANDFVSELNTVRETTTKEVKENLSKLDLRPEGSNVNKPEGDNADKAMDWEKFQGLSGDEQSKWADEHPDEFNAL